MIEASSFPASCDLFRVGLLLLRNADDTRTVKASFIPAPEFPGESVGMAGRRGFSWERTEPVMEMVEAEGYLRKFCRNLGMYILSQVLGLWPVRLFAGGLPSGLLLDRWAAFTCR